MQLANLIHVNGESLVPLLRDHLPYSLPVLSLIYGTLDAHSTSDISLGTSKALTTFSSPFPDLGGDRPWAVICAMQVSSETHLRIYCSAENPHHPSSRLPDKALQAFFSEVGRGLTKIYRAEEHGNGVSVGAINTCWDATVHEWVRGELEAPCTLYMAPTISDVVDGHTTIDQQDIDTKIVDLGLAWDIGRAHDVEMIRTTCDIPRTHEYYFALNARTTVLRPRAPALAEEDFRKQPAVSWIMTHADGALGALYTIPRYRRKGLAKLVITRHLLSSSMNRAPGPGRGFCYVVEGNDASRKLWEALSWKKAWTVRWASKTS